MPLAAASYAFIHPSFFPLDPFHLLFENVAAFLWDLWTIHSKPSEQIHFPPLKVKRFGELVAQAIKTLSSTFCGIVRDPNLKRQSQYKIYEWMALVYWYILSIGIETGMNILVLDHFALYVQIVEFAMTIKPRTHAELIKLHNLIKKFFEGFQTLYIGDDPAKISHFRLCIFQLIQLPHHIEWNGSIRLGSQATVERTIEELGHRIRSRKAPFTNLANIILEKELSRLLLLYYPNLQLSTSTKIQSPLSGSLYVSRKEKKIGTSLYTYLIAVCDYFHLEILNFPSFSCWSKLRISPGITLNSLTGETQSPPSRSHHYFEAISAEKKLIYGEALTFLAGQDNIFIPVIVFRKLENVTMALGMLRGVWSSKLSVLPITSVQNLIGIWSSSGKKWVYILRKHSGLEWLTSKESEQENEDEE